MSATEVSVEPAPLQKMPSEALAEKTPDIDVGAILIWLSVILVCGLVHTTDAEMHVMHPAMLLPACLWMLWPAKTGSVRQVQTVVFVYLMWLLWAACFDVLWTWHCPWDASLRISSTLPAVMLIGMGHWVRRRNPASTTQAWQFTQSALATAVTVIVVHAGGLLILWRCCYGFGWEEDAVVLGRLGFFAIVLTGLMPVACVFMLRATLSATVAMLLLARSMS